MAATLAGGLTGLNMRLLKYLWRSAVMEARHVWLQTV